MIMEQNCIKNSVMHHLLTSNNKIISSTFAQEIPRMKSQWFAFPLCQVCTTSACGSSNLLSDMLMNSTQYYDISSIWSIA
mmetsp:Transcript_18317/g.27331  ORF Transcript_18317/g.27331 Transcript_18317/m.27331 type:complete len:80 (-) Transcript_18317:103-342(-)